MSAALSISEPIQKTGDMRGRCELGWPSDHSPCVVDGLLPSRVIDIPRAGGAQSTVVR